MMHDLIPNYCPRCGSEGIITKYAFHYCESCQLVFNVKVSPIGLKNCEQCGRLIPEPEYNNPGHGEIDKTGLCYACAIKKSKLVSKG